MKKLLFMAVLLFSVSVAYASNLSLSMINNQISPYDSAKFLLKLDSSLSKKDSYMLSTNDIWWSITTEPLTDYTTGLEALPGKTAETTLFLKPRDSIPFGHYDVELAATAEGTGEVLTSVVSVDVREDLVNYPMNIDASLILPEYLDPRKTSSVQILLKNNNRKNINNLTIKLKSAFFEKTAVVDLEPEKTKTIDFSISFDKMVEPQTDTADVELIYEGKTVKATSKEYKIYPYSGFKVNAVTEKKFLGSVITYTFTNDGNVPYTDKALIETTFFKRVFTSTNPETASVSIDGKYYLAREVTLSPNQSLVVNAKVDYKPILYLIILAIIGLIVYFIFRAPIIGVKEVKEIMIDEGGISSLTVIIKLKNRSEHPVSHVKLVDRIPHIAAFERKGAETLQPSKIYAYPDGTALSWIIPKLDAGEVRVIAYRIKTKLGVIGELRLKPAIVQYGNRKTYSNPIDAVSP